MPRSGRAERGRNVAWSALHVLTLCCLAFALPLLDLIGRSAEFLVIRRIDGSAVLALPAALILLVPIPFLIVVVAGEWAGSRTGRVVTSVVVALLSVPIVLRIEAATGLAGGNVAMAVAVLSGVAAGIAYGRSAPARSFVTFASPALVVVPLVFLLQPGVRQAAFSSENGEVLSPGGASSPVFLVVFDELSWPALVGEDGAIDRERYPNLAALADESMWFRNAYTVADTTNVAVPAILTGRFPPRGALPLAADHSRSIFSLLGGEYRILADEPITRICPARLNEYQTIPLHPVRRLTRLASDLSVVWLHLVLPSPYRDRLPSISNTWEGFATGNSIDSDVSRAPRNDEEFFSLAVEELSREWRVDQFRNLLSRIDPADDRVLYFAHVLLPHVPWEYLPSGQTYSVDRGRIHGLVDDLWLPEPEPVRLASVRYLMQVELVDRLVGELIETLRRTGMYEKSLVILVSDHGTSFRPGDRRREYSPTNAAEVLPVPLLIKAPGQTAGRVIDEPVSVLDILPTAVDMLGIDASWSFDGRSMIRSSEEKPLNELRVATKSSGDVVVSLPELEVGKRSAARALSMAIGSPSDPFRFGRGGPHADLLGRPVAEVRARNGNLRGAVRNRERLLECDPTAEAIPLLVEGVVIPDREDCCDVALALNGEFVATAGTYPAGSGRHAFFALLPHGLLRHGRNEVELYRIVDGAGAPDGGLVVERMAGGSPRRYEIETGGDGQPVLMVDGRPLRMGSALDGWLEGASRHDDRIRVQGWAVDAERRTLVSEVVVFHQGRLLDAGPTWVPKGPVVEAFGEPNYMHSGFAFDLSPDDVPGLERIGLRVFAVTEDGRASELKAAYLPFDSATGEERIELGNGIVHELDPDALDGEIDSVEARDEGVVISGWAADLEALVPATEIVVYHNGRFLKREAPHEERADVDGKGSRLRCGFGFAFEVDRATALGEIASGRARFYAIAPDGRATRLGMRNELSRPTSP